MKTFTKKSAAIKAAGAHLKSIADSIGFDVFSTGVEATETNVDGATVFAATIFVDGHDDDQLAKITEASPDFNIAVQEAASAETAPADAPKATKAEGARRRVSDLTGYTLAPAKFDADGAAINPRKVGSFGHASMGIIVANPGITVDAFLKAGGRMTDLRWDIEHGNVVSTTVEPATETEEANA